MDKALDVLEDSKMLDGLKDKLEDVVEDSLDKLGDTIADKLFKKN